MEQNKRKVLENKFLKNATIEEKYFLEKLNDWLDEHSKSREKNKKDYWSLNEKLIAWIATKSGLDKMIVFVLSLVSAIMPFIGSILTLKILSILNFETEIWKFIIAGCVFLIVTFVVGIVWYKQMNLKKRLQLRKYGETWIRHTVMEAVYEKEILSYICSVGEYENKTEQEQKKLFIKNILIIFQKNIDKFEENMKSMEEVIQ